MEIAEPIKDLTVIDDFLLKSDFDQIVHTVNNPKFFWYYNKYLEPNMINWYDEEEKDLLSNFYFSHSFIDGAHTQSQHLSIMEPLLIKLNSLAFLRVRVHMFTNRENLVVYGYHTDYPLNVCDKIVSAVFYLDDTNGKTLFKDGREVSSKSNRISLFPCGFVHSSTNCTNAQNRKVINIDYIPAF